MVQGWLGKRKNYSPHKKIEDHQLKQLSSLQKELWVKIYRSKKKINVKIRRKRRSAVFRLIKKRKAELHVMKPMANAENIQKFKWNTQIALALKKNFKTLNTKKPTFPPMESIIDKVEKIFNDKNLETLVRRDNLSIPSNTIVRGKINRMRLKNYRATVPDVVKSEDIKAMSDLDVSLKLNGLIMTKSSILTDGYNVPILKPGKKSVKQPVIDL